PLGMTSTVSRDHDRSEIEGLAVGYARPKKRFVKVGPVLRLGGGSLVSTIDDLAKWDAALHSDVLVRLTTLDQIWTPQILTGGKVANMGRDGQGRHFKPGFGWFIGNESERRLVHHSGGVDGFASHIDR
ncbi:MAG: serine hydrolase, partial [Rhodothermales bacterium]